MRFAGVQLPPLWNLTSFKALSPALSYGRLRKCFAQRTLPFVSQGRVPSLRGSGRRKISKMGDKIFCSWRLIDSEARQIEESQREREHERKQLQPWQTWSWQRKYACVCHSEHDVVKEVANTTARFPFRGLCEHTWQFKTFQKSLHIKAGSASPWKLFLYVATYTNTETVSLCAGKDGITRKDDFKKKAEGILLRSWGVTTRQWKHRDGRDRKRGRLKESNGCRTISADCPWTPWWCWLREKTQKTF